MTSGQGQCFETISRTLLPLGSLILPRLEGGSNAWEGVYSRHA